MNAKDLDGAIRIADITPLTKEQYLVAKNLEIPNRVQAAAAQLIANEFDATDRIDSVSIERQRDGEHHLFVNANKGNVGSGTCEFVWKL